MSLRSTSRDSEPWPRICPNGHRRADGDKPCPECPPTSRDSEVRIERSVFEHTSRFHEHVACEGCELASLRSTSRDSEVREAVEGTVRYRRSDTTEPKVCICCPGEPSHVFGYYLEGDDGKQIEGTGGGWVFQTIRRIPEGTRVRLAILDRSSDGPQADRPEAAPTIDTPDKIDLRNDPECAACGHRRHSHGDEGGCYVCDAGVCPVFTASEAAPTPDRLAGFRIREGDPAARLPAFDVTGAYRDPASEAAPVVGLDALWAALVAEWPWHWANDHEGTHRGPEEAAEAVIARLTQTRTRDEETR